MPESQSRLAVIIDSSGAKKNVDSLSEALTKLTTKGELTVASIGKLGVALGAAVAAGAAAGTTALAAMIKTTADAGVEVSRLSKIANASTTQFQRYAVAANAAGISNEKFSDIMKDVNDKVGDFLSTGGGELQDFFKQIAPRVGVTADQFKNLSGPDALQLYVNTLQKANISQAQMTFYMEAIANDATALIPMFQDNGKAMNEMADIAQKLGLILDEKTIKSAQELETVGWLAESAMSGLRTQIASGLMPTVSDLASEMAGYAAQGIDATAVSETLNDWLKNVAKAAVTVAGAFMAASKGIGGMIDIWKGVKDIDLSHPIDAYNQIKDVVANVNTDVNKDLAGVENWVNEAWEKINKAGSTGGNEFIKNLTNMRNQVSQLQGSQGTFFPGGGTKKEKAYTEDAAQRLLDQINQQTASLQTQLDTTTKISSTTAQRVKFEQQIAELKGRAQLTADQKSILARSDEITQALKLQETLQAQVTTLDDYRIMQAEITPKEAEQNVTLQKRLEILQKMVALKRLTPEAAGKQASDLISNSVLPDSVIAGVNQAGGTLTSGATNKDLSGQGLAMIGLQIDPQLEIIQKLKKAQTDYASWLNQQEKTITENSTMNEQQRQQALDDLHKQGMQNQAALSTAVYSAELASAENSFSGISDAMGTMFGEQSAAYKAAFVTQKAFALAQAAIQLPMAMGQALAGLPFPANLAAMATVAGLMATITSSITSAAATGFEKGGYTGSMGTKSVAGVVHGQEYVFDAAATRRIGVSNLEAIRNGNLDATLSKPGFGTGNNSVSASGGNNQTNHISQVINMPQNSGMTQQEMDSVLKRNNKQLVTELSNQTLEGKGQFGKSLRAAQGRGNRMT